MSQLPGKKPKLNKIAHHELHEIFCIKSREGRHSEETGFPLLLSQRKLATNAFTANGK